MNDALLGALGGGAVGLVSGFIVSVLVLQLRRLRNTRLLARGSAPIKDALRPPLSGASAAAGAVLGGGLSMVVPPPTAIALGGGTVPAALLLLTLGITIAQVRERTPPPDA